MEDIRSLVFPLVHLLINRFITFVSFFYAVTKLFSHTLIVIFCLVTSFSILVRTNKSSLLPSNSKLHPLRDPRLLFKTMENAYRLGTGSDNDEKSVN